MFDYTCSVLGWINDMKQNKEKRLIYSRRKISISKIITKVKCTKSDRLGSVFILQLSGCLTRPHQTHVTPHRLSLLWLPGCWHTCESAGVCSGEFYGCSF